MALPKWLDRLWLTLIAVSFCVIVPLYTLLWIERLGFSKFLLVVALFFSAGFLRFFIDPPVPGSNPRRWTPD